MINIGECRLYILILFEDVSVFFGILRYRYYLCPRLYTQLRCLPSIFENSHCNACKHSRTQRRITALCDTKLHSQNVGSYLTPYLSLCAAVSVKYGADRLEIYRALTSNPAEICGIENKGYIKPGYDADIAVFSGDPLDVMTFCEEVYIKGKKVY